MYKGVGDKQQLRKSKKVNTFMLHEWTNMTFSNRCLKKLGWKFLENGLKIDFIQKSGFCCHLLDKNIKQV